MNIILFAIPVFFLLIGAELLAEKIRKTQYYRLNDALTSLSIGGLSRVTGVMKNLAPFTFYILIYEHFAFFELKESMWIYVSVFVLYDFLYYWNHRFGHEMSLFWAAHVVHHSSEEYNLTTALRQTSGSFFNFIFFLPLAFIGVDPLLLLSVASINLVYQFWVHTRHIKKLGILEWFLVTPSNHRVHHAQNKIYLDRNYGGVFIIWDRLFGTFQEELDSEVPIYGVRKALSSWNPFFANLQVYKLLMFDSFHTKLWSDKLRVWFGRTGWRPSDVAEKFPIEKVDLSKFSAYQTEISWKTKIYALLQYIVISLLVLFLLINASGLSISLQLGIAFLVIFSSVNLAWIMENRSTALWLEWPKFIMLMVLLSVLKLDISAGFIFAPILLSLFVLCQLHLEGDTNTSSQKTT
ncbi:sterol desaturase family protein [Glaciecola sp. MF2-115]|uniref:sterol desaturase family protein n=1 Tax=Glaciecola sp. MF2-115 TaxID=3384827 RepID=UPI0039A1F0F9